MARLEFLGQCRVFGTFVGGTRTEALAVPHRLLVGAPVKIIRSFQVKVGVLELRELLRGRWSRRGGGARYGGGRHHWWGLGLGLLDWGYPAWPRGLEVRDPSRIGSDGLRGGLEALARPEFGRRDLGNHHRGRVTKERCVWG